MCVPNTENCWNSTASTTKWPQQKEICSICGLLGAHKPHKILLKKEMSENIGRMLKDLRMQFSLMPSRSEIVGAEGFGGLLEDRAKLQMDRCKKVLEVRYKVGSPGNQVSDQKNHF